MQPDTINAIGIIVMVVFTAAVTFFFRVKPWHVIFQGGRIWWSLLATASSCVFIVSASGAGQKCGIEGGPEAAEGYMAIIWLCCVFCLFLLVDKKYLLIPSCLIVLGMGNMLGNQFETLVYESGDYYAIDAHTHKLMNKNCSSELVPKDIVAIKQWHSWFTGIYKAKKQERI